MKEIYQKFFQEKIDTSIKGYELIFLGTGSMMPS